MKQKVQGFSPSLRFGLAAVVSLAVTFSGAMVGAADANADEAIIDDTASTSQSEVAKQEVPTSQPKSTVESASSQSNTVAESRSPQQHEVKTQPKQGETTVVPAPARAPQKLPECTAEQSPKWKVTPGVTTDSWKDNAVIDYLGKDKKARLMVQYSLLREGGAASGPLAFTPYVSYLKPGTDTWTDLQEIKLSPYSMPKFLPPEDSLDKTKDGWPATVKLVLKRTDGACEIPADKAAYTFEVPGGELLSDAEVMSFEAQYDEGEDPKPGNDTCRHNKGDLICLYPTGAGSHTDAKARVEELVGEDKSVNVLWVDGKCADVAAAGTTCKDITYAGKGYAEIEVKKYFNYVNEVLKYTDGKTAEIKYWGAKPRPGYAYQGGVQNHYVYKDGSPVKYVSDLNRIRLYKDTGSENKAFWYGNIEPEKPTAVDNVGESNDTFQIPDDNRLKYYLVSDDGKVTYQSQVSGTNKVSDVTKYVDGKATVKVRAHVKDYCNLNNDPPTSAKYSDWYSIDNSYCGYREWTFTFYGSQKVKVVPPSFDDETGTFTVPDIPGVKWMIDGKEVTPGTHDYPDKHGKISITAVPGTPKDPNVPIELVDNNGPYEHEYDLRLEVVPPAPVVERLKCGVAGSVKLPDSEVFEYSSKVEGDKAVAEAVLKNAADFKLKDGAVVKWELNLTAEPCPPQPDNPTKPDTGDKPGKPGVEKPGQVIPGKGKPAANPSSKQVVRTQTRVTTPIAQTGALGTTAVLGALLLAAGIGITSRRYLLQRH
ncbi:hypothetical protein [Varibaculum massiliense]|uniref:hypothetical protein n=1 Tax=Varibaculum massiliense TaxID=1852372 RepID=UPI00288B51DB|nr:hypothetical protein [Varibaculum massiliense]